MPDNSADGYGSRKWLAYLITIGLAFVSLWFGKMPSGDVAHITTVAIGAYMLGNAASKFAGK